MKYMRHTEGSDGAMDIQVGKAIGRFSVWSRGKILVRVWGEFPWKLKHLHTIFTNLDFRNAEN